METVKKFKDGSVLSTKMANYKNLDIFDIKFSEGNNSFIFGKEEGTIKIPKDAMGNSQAGEGKIVEFTTIGDKYYSISPTGTKAITKAQADKIEADNLRAATVAVIDDAANKAVTSEKIKSNNIKKIGMIVISSILVISATVAIFNLVKKSDQAQA